MTYGWSILVIAVVIAALFALGVFSGGSNLPTGCIAQPGFLCQTPRMNTTGNVIVAFGEALGTSITITGAACTNTSSAPLTSTFNSISLSMASGEGQISLVFQCPISSGAIGTAFHGTLWIQYTKNGATGQVSQVATLSAESTTTNSVWVSGAYGAPALCPDNTVTYATAGGPYTTTVPAGCTQVTMQLWGGGAGAGGAGNCGGGGYIAGTYSVSAGTSIYVYVGGGGVSWDTSGSGTGGTNGGGAGYPGGAGGGGCSAISTIDYSSWQSSMPGIFIVAAGGGGGGGSTAGTASGGPGGGLTGGNGEYDSVSGTGGSGGTQTAGGTSGGSSYTGGLGGSGNGGGGCGYYGGGAPTTGNAGGGGGSSWNSISITSVTNTGGSGIYSGNTLGTIAGEATCTSLSPTAGQAGQVKLTWSS